MELDWERRFDHMQNHLGEHMLSALFKREYDGDNRGFHLGDDVGCFDIDLKEITPEMLRIFETQGKPGGLCVAAGVGDSHRKSGGGSRLIR